MPSVKSINSSIKITSLRTQLSYKWFDRALQSGPWSEIVYGPTNTLVATAQNRYTYSTNNGETWPPYVFPFNPAGAGESYSAVGWGNGLWIMLEGLDYAPSGTQNFYTSVNILTGWTSNTFNPALTSLRFHDCQYSSFHGRFIATGSKENRDTNLLVGAYSTDGLNWLSAGYLINGVPAPDNLGFTGNLVEGTQMPNNRLVTCGQNGSQKFGYSNDGGSMWNRGNYTAVSSPLGQNLQTGHTWTQVAYGYDGSANLPLSGRYVAVCGSGSTSTFQFAYSDDGIGWIGVQYTTPDFDRNWTCVTYGNGNFVAFGQGGYQAMSKNGKDWVAYANINSTAPVGDVTVANNRFVVVKNTSVGSGNLDALIAEFFK